MNNTFSFLYYPESSDIVNNCYSLVVLCDFLDYLKSNNISIAFDKYIKYETDKKYTTEIDK